LFRYFFTLVISIYVPAVIYTGYRLWQMTKYFFPSAPRIGYWFFFLLFSLAFFLSRSVGSVLPDSISESINLFSYYWLVALLYLFVFLLGLDLIRFINKLTGISSGFDKLTPHILLGAVILVGVILLYGTWNARHPRIMNYEITINKDAGSFKQLHVVMVSDLHLGAVVDRSRLEKMVNMINALKPDLILMPGDIIEDEETFSEQNMLATFGKLQSKLGTFVSPGNHEYYRGTTKKSFDRLKEVGISVLEDDYVKIADSFYIVGREDPAVERSQGKKRKDLGEILDDVDKKLPIILLNHQPTELETAEKEGVDLQLSGHTHRGQVFPANLITSRIFEQDWGYLKKGGLQLIVSCGYGTWGPPFRIGNKPEIVNIVINFHGGQA